MPTKIEKDAITGVETTGHEWDGIRELNNPLPKWWLYVFYATIVWSLGYWVLYPSIPTGKGHTDGLLAYNSREDVARDISRAREAQSAYRARIENASYTEIMDDPDLLNFAITGGRFAFAENCAACHAAGGAGQKGYPALADDDWLWGGKAEEIAFTIQHGIRSTSPDTRMGDMPRFGVDGMLTRAQINDVVEYVMGLGNRATDAAAAGRGETVFAENCASCHGEKGEGNRELGAPRLADNIWLYGASKATLVETVNGGRAGVMPTWAGRLDPVAIKQLAVYVHTLGGGEK
ncbi:cytochrome-c oxidase, cbb3-type subunit III [Arenibaculum pallidiluteum]|uniref:cytochrome-c oxidase, cbb3-type subunit III n=1 Tax=Arenibaculum pallidiluteum TaxID=2812559 RepID=UPI001A979EBA|nr:cytochrome-c oxidase, cbb3-type subunit III [Arenibaculum pallidiluteum]